MKSSNYLCLAAALMLGACGANQEPAATVPAAATPDPSVALAQLVEEYFERNLELNPILASSIGDSRYNDRLGNSISPEGRAKATALNQEFLDRVMQIDAEALQGQDRLTYETFRLSRGLALEGDQFHMHLQPLNQFFSFPNFFVQLGTGASKGACCALFLARVL